LEVLLGFVAGKPVLFFIDCDGSESQVDTYKAIGSGSLYVKLFFDRLWNPTRPIQESVMLACFVIKFIEEMDLDNFVGVGKDKLPQVVLILNDGRIGEFLIQNETQFIDSILPIIEKIDDVIKMHSKSLGGFTL